VTVFVRASERTVQRGVIVFFFFLEVRSGREGRLDVRPRSNHDEDERS
jgi:hypothetical protein